MRPMNIIIENDDAPFTYVKESSIEGLGLFASIEFKKGDLVVDYLKFPNDWYRMKFEDLTQEQIRKNWYVMEDNEYCITCDKYSKFSYINHSREPNCDWILSSGRIVANKNIEKNTELFVDYRLELRPNRTSYPDWI